MNKNDKKNLAKIVLFILFAVFLVFVLPVILYKNAHKNGNANLSGEDLVKQNQQIEEPQNQDTDNHNLEENIEIVEVNENDVNRINIQSIDIPPIEVPVEEPNKNINKDYSDPFYKQIKEQLEMQKSLPKLRIPNYYYEVKKNYIKNCADSSGKLHTFKKKPILIYVPRNEYYDSITQAFVAYNNQFKDYIVFNTVKNPNDADISIVFAENLDKYSDNNVLGFGGPQKIDTQGNIVYSKITLKTVQDGKAVSKIAMYNTVLHEIGHAIGVAGHSENPDDIMFKHAQADDDVKLKYFSQGDIETFKVIYSGNQYLIGKALEGAQKTKLKENLNYTEFYNESSDSYIKTAKTYREMGQYNKSIETLNKALKVNPDNARLYIELSSCYLGLKQDKKAEENAKIAVQKAQTNEDRADAYNLIGVINVHKNNNEEALQYYYRALTSDPSTSEYFMNYINNCLYMKNYKAAKEAYDTYYHMYKPSYFTERELKTLEFVKNYKSKP